MGERAFNYIIIIFLVLCVGSFGFIFWSGCARVQYKEITPSTKCNFAYMLIQLKSIKGMGAFEVSKFIDECFHDLNVIKCRKRIYSDKRVDNQDQKKKIDFFECLKE